MPLYGLPLCCPKGIGCLLIELGDSPYSLLVAIMTMGSIKRPSVSPPVSMLSPNLKKYTNTPNARRP